MVEYIHDHYRADYLSFGNAGILDWQKACVSMMYVHAFEVLGEKKYLDWANEALFVEYNLSDDMCWGANALLELSQHGVPPATRTYKDRAGIRYTMKYSYADIFDHGLTTGPRTAPAPYFGYYDDPAAGGQRGVFWNRQRNSYNTCTLGQAVILAFRMPESVVNGKAPREFATTWMKLQNDLLVDHNTGLVFDSYQLRNMRSSRGNYSYNNGVVLGALGLAYQKAREKHEFVPATAAKVVDFVVNHMTENGVLCSPSADFRNGNAHAFNGIFMHFAPLYLFSNCPADSRNQLKQFVSQCATAVWSQINQENKSPENKYAVSYSWGKPYNAAETRCMTTVSGAECLLTYLQLKANLLPVDYKK